MYFGLERPVFAPVTAETDGSVPTYGTAITVMKAVSSNIDSSVSTNNAYADNGVCESEAAVTSYSITFNTDDFPTSFKTTALNYLADTGTPAKLYGVAGSGAPGGFGFIANKQVSGVPYWLATWFYKVTFAPASQALETRQDSTTWQSSALTGTAASIRLSAVAKPVFFTEQAFTTQADALAFLQSIYAA
jgi:phi13 family phage major tail protein